MANNSDNPADPFKKALAEATKVMANNPELTINYTVDPSGISGDNIRLPQISRRMSREEVLIARGTSDALALYHRYHNEKTHARSLALSSNPISVTLTGIERPQRCKFQSSRKQRRHQYLLVPCYRVVRQRW